MLRIIIAIKLQKADGPAREFVWSLVRCLKDVVGYRLKVARNKLVLYDRCVCVCVYVRFGGYIYMAITTAVMSSPMKDVTWLHCKQ